VTDKINWSGTLVLSGRKDHEEGVILKNAQLPDPVKLLRLDKRYKTKCSWSDNIIVGWSSTSNKDAKLNWRRLNTSH
jgi:hypothetical protein